MTNYEKIKGMSIEELAIFLDCISTHEDVFDIGNNFKVIGGERFYDCDFMNIESWLEEEVSK